jgi:hypothetical protein
VSLAPKSLSERFRRVSLNGLWLFLFLLIAAAGFAAYVLLPSYWSPKSRVYASEGFPGTGDPFHSVSFFVEALARALLLDPAAATSARVDALRRAAEWLMRPEIGERGEANNRPYTHRRWILAAALGLTARVTGDGKFMRAARAYAADGLRLQTSEGVNPEKGGADVGYQMVGVVMAAHFIAAGPDRETQRAVVAMIERATHWQAAWIREDGTIDSTGSSRVLIETGRDGRVKAIPYHRSVEGFAYAAALTGDASFREIGERIARRRGWLR